MNIVCPNCGTSYDVDAAALGAAGRTVRCVRCRQTWLARVDDMVRADAMVEGADQIGLGDATAQLPSAGGPEAMEHEIPVPRVESPPLAHEAAPAKKQTAAAQVEPTRSRSMSGRRTTARRLAFGFGSTSDFRVSAPLAITIMAALAAALVIWRNDVVRLLPQTAPFFQFSGLGVNLRGLAFEDVRVSTETVNGSRVYVIEGVITLTSRKPMEIPRLRFVVQDARGAEIYAWNSVVDQAVARPGERVAFKSRLASPPAEAHSVVVRFFNRRDLAAKDWHRRQV